MNGFKHGNVLTDVGLQQNTRTGTTIDISVSFLKPARAGRHVAKGYVVKRGRTVGFIRGELYNEKGEMTATATASAFIVNKT